MNIKDLKIIVDIAIELGHGESYVCVLDNTDSMNDPELATTSFVDNGEGEKTLVFSYRDL